MHVGARPQQQLHHTHMPAHGSHQQRRVAEARGNVQLPLLLWVPVPGAQQQLHALGVAMGCSIVQRCAAALSKAAFGQHVFTACGQA